MTFGPFSTSERSGAIVVGVFALLSALAFAFIVFRAVRLATILFLEHDDSGNTSRPPEILLFRTQLGHYAGCLILSNMFISAAGLINLSWVSDSGLSQGPTCSAQGALMQIGVWGSCWFTGAHGVHTLSSLGFHVPPPRWRSLVGVALGWTVALIAGLVPLRMNGVYGPTGTSCAIAFSYPKEILVLEALPILLTALVSSVVYVVIFSVLNGKLNVNLPQKLRGPRSSKQRGDDRTEEYHRFIRVIIRSMFWFPLAFVFLCLPFCITHILMSAGQTVPFAWDTFANACIAMLGFVNVGLLCNTFRVISPVYFGPHAAGVVPETMMTFGKDTSGESSIVPHSKPFWQSKMPSHESSYQTYSSTSSPSRDFTWSSDTRLVAAEKPSYDSSRTKLAPSMLRNMIVLPAEPGQPFNGDTGVISSQSNTKKEEEPLTRDEHSLSIPTLGPGAPPAVNLSSLEITNKSATLAVRLGISVAAPVTTSQSSVLLSSQEIESEHEMVPAVPVTPIHHLEEVDLEGSENVGVPPFRPSSSASITSSTDSILDYSGEIMRAHRVRPLVQNTQVPEPSDDEHDTACSYPPTAQHLRAQTCRASMATIWSQETGYTLSLPPDQERDEAYRQLVANVLAPGIMLGDGADVGEVVTRPAAALSSTRRVPKRAKPLLRPIMVASTRFSSMLSPKSSSNMSSLHPTTVF